MDGSDGAGPDGRKRKREDYLAGLAALNHRRDNLEITPTVVDGLYSDMEAVSALWHHSFSDRLRLDPTEHPMLLAEPTFNTRDLREATVQMIFEQYGVPAAFLAKNAVLSAFATGRQTALTVDCGHEGTVVAGVHDGYVLDKSVTRAPVAGSLLTRCMLRSVGQRSGVAIRPRYAFQRKELAAGQFEVIQAQFSSPVRQSYHDWQVTQVAADIKETVCRVSDTTFEEERNANIPTVTYELPDGTEIQIGADRFKVPEVLFHPELATTFDGVGDTKGYGGVPVKSLQALVMDSVNRCDVDVRREMFGGIVLTGGTSLFNQLRDRLEKELTDEAPQVARVKVMSPVNALERRFSVWIGGSILASLGSFQQMWMSKAEYEEHGPALIHRKSP